MLLKSVLIPRLLNNPFASCFLINFDFLAAKFLNPEIKKRELMSKKLSKYIASFDYF